MKNKTKSQLLNEIENLRQHNTELETIINEMERSDESNKEYGINPGILAQTEKFLTSAELELHSKNVLLRNMSHNVRTAMNSIIGLTDAAQQTNQQQKQFQYLSQVKSSASLLLTLLDDVIDYLKLESEQLELEKIEFNIQEIVNYIHDLFLNQIFKKQINIHIRMQQDVPSLLIGDPERLKRILINLLNSAVKITEHGEIILQIQLLEVQDADATLQFSILISETGLSNTAIRPSLFQHDEMSSALYNHNFEVDLGIKIAARLLELMDFRLWKDKRENGFLEFNFSGDFTISPSENQDSSQCALSQQDIIGKFSQLQNPVRILVVEDEVINQEVILALLEKLSISIDIAENGYTAIQKLGQTKYDLILMDIQMPEMDGLITTQKIRENQRFSDLPIIALTAYATPKDRDQCLSVGMNDYITKPIEPSILYNILYKFLIRPVTK